MRWIFAVLAASIALSAGQVARSQEATANPQPGLPASTVGAIKCMYPLIRAIPTVQSLEVYAIDDHRSAIEYGFRDSDGTTVVDDLVLLGGNHVFIGDKGPRTRPPSRSGAANDFTLGLNDIASKCNVGWAFDNVYPQPKPRDEWVRVNWPLQASPSP